MTFVLHAGLVGYTLTRMEPWYKSYYVVDICHLGSIDFSYCLQQNPSELAKRIKWLISFIIIKEQMGSIVSSDSHQMLFF